MTPPEKLPIVVLISGNGSNLQAIIAAIQQGLPVKICAVISNRSDAFGLERAKQAGIPAHAISHREFHNRRAFEAALQEKIDEYQPKIVVLAGFMRRLTAEFVAHYVGRMINIHPSLLPKYPGLDTHRQVLNAKDTEHGVSIHYVTAEVDKGPLICQASLPVHANDTEERLTQRIHDLEHQLYPQVLGWLAAGRLQWTAAGVTLDGKALKPPQN